MFLKMSLRLILNLVCMFHALMASIAEVLIHKHNMVMEE